MAHVIANPQFRAQPTRWFLITVVGVALVLMTGLFLALSFAGLLSLDLLAAVPVALAGMASAVFLFDAISPIFAKAAKPIELPSGPNLA